MDVFERVRRFVAQACCEHLGKEHVGVLAVTHGGWIMEFLNFLKHLRKTPRDALNNTKNTALYHVRFLLSEEQVGVLSQAKAKFEEEAKEGSPVSATHGLS